MKQRGQNRGKEKNPGRSQIRNPMLEELKDEEHNQKMRTPVTDQEDLDEITLDLGTTIFQAVGHSSPRSGSSFL